MSSGLSEDKTPLGPGDPLIVWPTVEDVRCSLEVQSNRFFCLFYGKLYHHIQYYLEVYSYLCYSFAV